MSIILAIALAGVPAPPGSGLVVAQSRSAPAVVRIIRAGRGDRKAAEAHPGNRVRRMIVIHPDGRRVELIVLEYE